MDEKHGKLARIGADLGLDVHQEANTRKRRVSLARREHPDFCALFAAEGLQQLETYLAKRAAYRDYLVERDREGKPTPER